MLPFFIGIALSLIIVFLFFYISQKESWEALDSSIFECGFTSYFYSRFSFSIHFFMVALIFLFLDLELCFFLPFFNEQSSSFNMSGIFFFFLVVLFLGLVEEWAQDELDWKF